MFVSNGKLDISKIIEINYDQIEVTVMDRWRVAVHPDLI
jgi:hypothetical protein